MGPFDAAFITLLWPLVSNGRDLYKIKITHVHHRPYPIY